ncbi:hypothetical protein HZZ00_22305 [Streptomyces sp. NEAU-sy36]|uniref:hypothetical protein n=1 Tax=unclassified Streptomyces TaxID=2593676 RepID=UPI0015D645A7|nr:MULTISPECIES: hypothetical protein [unclassified Streptomyces]QLJ03445.1 hypothetical protein HZZ00_22305 [Streptomyces sp. NEAU-sy36]
MRAVSERRSSRSLPWAGAVLALVLITLMHVFACCHGPTAGPAQRADVLVSAGPGAPSPDHQSHCQGLDEPTAQPPRDAGPVDPPLAALAPAGPLDAAPAVPAPALPCASPASSPGHARALLGVWRT